MLKNIHFIEQIALVDSDFKAYAVRASMPNVLKITSTDKAERRFKITSNEENRSMFFDDGDDRSTFFDVPEMQTEPEGRQKQTPS